MDHDGIVNVEESRSLTNLLEFGLTESLLDDNVEQLVHDGLTVEHLVGVGHAYSYCRLIVNEDLLLLTFINRVKCASILQLR